METCDGNRKRLVELTVIVQRVRGGADGKHRRGVLRRVGVDGGRRRGQRERPAGGPLRHREGQAAIEHALSSVKCQVLLNPLQAREEPRPTRLVAASAYDTAGVGSKVVAVEIQEHLLHAGLERRLAQERAASAAERVTLVALEIAAAQADELGMSVADAAR